ncbi:hypothetical protein GCK72_007069 [Caenorhabditis remanei]|uniref:Uncharacterized protein n=1 Tax=Caenorhabditis remanei TaxID=31234 RepID=A0A6A5HIZ4_CAERE|nr:hypothetical protein GCK72_007069 [Caenorhabditis remanei]KAF1767111.1 hypothetical protein GCK72_007069 [Caenorhabditis remanei]
MLSNSLKKKLSDGITKMTKMAPSRDVAAAKMKETVSQLQNGFDNVKTACKQKYTTELHKRWQEEQFQASKLKNAFNDFKTQTTSKFMSRDDYNTLLNKFKSKIGRSTSNSTKSDSISRAEHEKIVESLKLKFEKREKSTPASNEDIRILRDYIQGLFAKQTKQTELHHLERKKEFSQLIEKIEKVPNEVVKVQKRQFWNNWMKRIPVFPLFVKNAFTIYFSAKTISWMYKFGLPVIGTLLLFAR